MNEQNVKALFMAQYLGQKVLGCHNFDKLPKDVLEPRLLEMVNTYLLLRSVSQLTDDEKLQLGIVAFPMFVPFPEKDYDTLRKLALTILDRGHLGSRTHQVLVRYGVLVPFTFIGEDGKPKTYSEADILAKGWAKLV